MFLVYLYSREAFIKYIKKTWKFFQLVSLIKQSNNKNSK